MRLIFVLKFGNLNLEPGH